MQTRPLLDELLQNHTALLMQDQFGVGSLFAVDKHSD
jgi:hypothetical protein